MKNTMKKALSLLVAFALVCVPMIASAAVGDGVAMPSDCIYSGDYVTVGAGETAYFEIGTGMTAGTYGFTVEGEGDFDVAVCTEGNGEYPYAEGEAVSAVDGVVETEITSFESTYNYAAFAITNNSENDVDYLVTILFPEGTQDNPKAVTLAVGTPVEVTIAAGVTYYIGASLPMMNTEYNLTVTGAPGFYYGGGMMRPSPDNNGTYTATVSASMFSGGMANFNISNGTEEEQTYTLTLENMPAGASEGNPEIIEASDFYTTSFSEHFYSFTATESGTFTVSMSAEEGWMYQINGVTADSDYYYGDMHWCDDDPVVMSESIDVNAGDVYTIYVGSYMSDEMVYWSFNFEAKTLGEKPLYNENGADGYLSVADGYVDYDMNADYVYTILEFTPDAEGNYTIDLAGGAMAGIVSYNGMWVTVEPSAEVVNSYTIEWECTSVGQTIWVAVIAETETVSINVSYEEAIVVVIPEYDYENVVTPEEFVYNGDTANFDYVETFDDIVDNAVLGDDGYYHLNSADGPVLFACLNDDLMSLVGANSYGQLTYVEYDEDGNVVSKTHYGIAFEEYAACAYTDDAGYMYYPLTEDLIVMFQNVGANNGWYGENGFVGGDIEDAWMFACYYDEEVTTIEPVVEPEYDPNGDGEFNMFDYVFVKATVLSNDASEEEIAAADVNGDGKLNMFDYIAVKSAYFAI